MEELLAVALAIVIYLIIDGHAFTPPEYYMHYHHHSLYQTLRSKYPYMSEEDIEKMVRKTLRIK